MLDDDDIDQTLRMAILNLMRVLYDCGITEIHVGGIMRILGVDNAVASAHDDERVVLDEGFVRYVDLMNQPRPTDQSLH
jgi:hypothetical protein